MPRSGRSRECGLGRYEKPVRTPHARTADARMLLFASHSTSAKATFSFLKISDPMQNIRMVAIQNGHLTSIPLEDAASKTKFLPVDHPTIRLARDIGISFGD